MPQPRKRRSPPVGAQPVPKIWRIVDGKREEVDIAGARREYLDSLRAAISAESEPEPRREGPGRPRKVVNPREAQVRLAEKMRGIFQRRIERPARAAGARRGSGYSSKADKIAEGLKAAGTPRGKLVAQTAATLERLRSAVPHERTLRKRIHRK